MAAESPRIHAKTSMTASEVVKALRAKAFASCDPKLSARWHRKADELEMLMQPPTAWTVPS